MVNLIWIFMIIIGLLFSFYNGTTSEVNQAMFEASGNAVELIIGFIAIFTFWLGMMEVAKKAGLLRVITSICSPFLSRLFPDLPKKDPSFGFIMSNVTANFFGLGNAATPFGIKAMKEMQKLNPAPDKASRSMVTFLCLNTAAITFFPATIVSLRLTEGAADPLDIVIPAFLATLVSCSTAIIYDRISWQIVSRRRK
ncbi:nucleoside recognition domain-containing protein [Jeotgalibacillus sp. R-1-5s-1]|uniref:nucleoside recognition domain-containing protein n=1 Tax=Jeotgalibacillus sp. R-1-5s-1 TaxID=2555897 RepID=UPI00106A78C9|nr:nucleoside recognition domain-containing protein [Jeotgalibacillus sp. R-1-5s-1]TFE00450.1 spore maturation protein [Jeotgalibacillus sp. R-1-5s-1]